MGKTTKVQLIVLLAIIANVVVILFTFNSTSTLLNDQRKLTTKINHSVDFLSLLYAVEREIGYVGLIHHQKNYVLRRNEIYFQEALASYERAKATLAQLKLSPIIEPSELQSINTIESTIDEYYEKLLILNTPENKGVSVQQADDLVRVDDSRAAFAISQLFNSKVPTVISSNLQTVRRLESAVKRTYYVSVFICVVIILFTLVALRQIKKQQESINKFSGLINASPDAIIHADHKGRVLMVNQAATKLFGYSDLELEALKVEELVPMEFRKKHLEYRESFTSSLQSREMQAGRRVFGLTKSGEQIPVQIAIGSFRVDNNIESISVIRDLQPIEALQDEHTFLNKIIDGLNSYIIVADTHGRVVDLNKTLIATLDLDEHELQGQFLWELNLWQSHSKDKIMKLVTGALKDEKSGSFDSTVLLHGSPVAVNVAISTFEVDKTGDRFVICSAVDINDRKAFEKRLSSSEKKFKKVFNRTTDGLVLFDIAGQILWMNSTAENLLSLVTKEGRAANIYDAFLSADKALMVEKISQVKYDSGLTKDFEFSLASDKSVKTNISISLFDQKGERQYLATITDITEVAETNEKLAALVGEKNVLLNEIHHRVKNNLQVINSLLSLQQQHVAPEIASELHTCQQRIRAVALVHQMLYEQDEFASIDVVSYARKLSELLLMPGKEQKIFSVMYDLPSTPVLLPIKVAVPIGFIVNEVLTNTVKHAFGEKKHIGADGKEHSGNKYNKIVIQISTSNDELSIRISDNGVGFEPEQFHQSHSLGHTLIELFTAQAHGTVELDASSGTCFAFTFDLKKLRNLN